MPGDPRWRGRIGRIDTRPRHADASRSNGNRCEENGSKPSVPTIAWSARLPVAQGMPAAVPAARRTSWSIGWVSLPVKVFCWLTW